MRTSEEIALEQVATQLDQASALVVGLRAFADDKTTDSWHRLHSALTVLCLWGAQVDARVPCRS